MVQVTPLVSVVAVASHFVDSTSLNGLVVRQITIDPSSLPSACQSPCQVVNDVTNCGGNLNCICTSKMGKQLEQCMNCLVSAEPVVEFESESALGSWNDSCGGHLKLSSSGDGGQSTSGGVIRLETGNRMAMCIAAGLTGVMAFMSL